MATRTQCTGVQSDIRTDFAIKEGSYRNVKASEHCRPSRQALFSKELSPVQISIVSCKGKDGICEWIVFNSNKELYFYPFEGVGKVSRVVVTWSYDLSVFSQWHFLHWISSRGEVRAWGVGEVRAWGVDEARAWVDDGWMMGGWGEDGTSLLYHRQGV